MDNVTIIEGASDTGIADWLEAWILRAMARTSEEVWIALPGGSTPFPILQELATRDLEWTRLEIEPTDDRVVSEDHPASNLGRLRALLEPLGAGLSQLRHGYPATRHELVWLGMGIDGHIASLFPNTDPRLDDSKGVRRLTPDPLPPEAPFDRITLTLPALLAAGEILFVIRGADKRKVFEAALAGEHDLPVARLLAGARERSIPVTCFT